LKSLAGGTCVAGHEVIVLLLPWGHILGKLTREWICALLCHLILCFKALLNFVVGLVVLVVLAEDFGVAREILLIGGPFLGESFFRVVVVFHLEVSGTYIVVIDSVLNMLHIVVSHWHTDVSELVDHFLLRVLATVPNSVVNAIQLFSEVLFGLLTVDLGKLLHLELVLTHQVLFLLSQVTEVVSWGASKNLTGRDSLTLSKGCTSSQDSESFNFSATGNRCSHTNE
jgi:hypothetical protein